MFTLALTLAAATLVSSPGDGTYTYVSTMNGLEVGRTAITVKHQPGGVVLTETGSGNLNGQAGSVKDTLMLDASLAPQSYTSDASVADSRNMKATLTFDGAQARQTGDVVKTYSLAGSARHFVLMDIGPFSGFFMLPAQVRAWDRAPVVAIVPNFAQSLALSPDPGLQPPRPAGVPAADAQISFNSTVEVTFWYNPRTMVVDEVDVPAQGLVVRRM